MAKISLDKIENEIHHGKFSDVNETMKTVIIGDISSADLLIFLDLTKDKRNKFPYRAKFLSLVEIELQSRMAAKKVAEFLLNRR